MNTGNQGRARGDHRPDQDFVDKKNAAPEFAKDYLIDLLFHFSQEKSLYKLEANINFRWGHSIHVGEEGFDILEGIDKLF